MSRLENAAHPGLVETAAEVFSRLNLPGARALDALRMFQSVEALGAEFAGLCGRGEIIGLSGFWGQRSERAGEGTHHTSKFLGLTCEGIRVCTRLVNATPRGSEHVSLTSGTSPWIAACIHASRSVTLDGIKERLEALREERSHA